MSLHFYTWLKLNWKKAADKGALCGTRVELIHAEELVWQVEALSRGKKPPKILSNFLHSLQHCVACCAGGSLSAPGNKAGRSRAGCVATTLRSGNNSQVGQQQNRFFSPSAWQLSRCLLWHNEVCSWGGRDFGLMGGGDTKRPKFNH